MHKPLGGEFEFFASDYAAVRPGQSAARFGAANVVWTDTGRSAILIAASVIRQRGGVPRVWVPAYSCESIVQAFRQSGFSIRYYSDRAYAPSAPVPEPAPGETLLFIHYFGHRNDWMLHAVPRYRASGVWVIEDGVQGSLMAGLGANSDFALTSDRKVLPVTDGAALLSADPLDVGATGLLHAPASESFVSARFLGKILRASRTPQSEFLSLFEASERELDSTIVPRRPSWLSTWMLERLDIGRAINRRRENWEALAGELSHRGLTSMVTPLFQRLADGDAPLGLPVRVAAGQRDALRRYLAEKEIYCAVHWPLDHLGSDPAFAEERHLESSALTLPIDQRMTAADVRRLAESIGVHFQSTGRAAS